MADCLGITGGDVLSAVTNMAAIIIAVLIAAKVAPAAEERKARRDQQERLLRILIATSPIPANPEYQAAIALIPVDFKGCPRVLEARTDYLAAVNAPIPPDQDSQSGHYQKQRERQAKLIAAIAEKLEFDLTEEGLLSGSYLTQGFVDREMLQLEAMSAWPRIATALEESNRIISGTLPVPVDNDDQGKDG